MVANMDVRCEAKTAHLPLWKIADALCVSEPTMTRKLRHELPEAEKEQIRRAIIELKEAEQK